MAIERSNRMSKLIRIPSNITLKDLRDNSHYEAAITSHTLGEGSNLQEALDSLSNICPKNGIVEWCMFNKTMPGVAECMNNGIVYYPKKLAKKQDKDNSNKSKGINLKLDKIIHLLEHNENHTKSFNNKNDLHFYMPHTRNFDTQLKSLNKQLHKDINLNWNIYVHATDSSSSYFSLQITDGKGSDFEQYDNGIWHYSPSDIVSKAEMKAVASLISSFCKQEDMPVKAFVEA